MIELSVSGLMRAAAALLLGLISDLRFTGGLNLLPESC